MKPTREQVIQWAVSAQLVGTTRDYTRAVAPRIERFAEFAYKAGAEKGKEAYEREHCRHAVPLPDALKAMQDQVAEACAKVCDDLADCEQNTDAYRAGAHWCREIIRCGEWRKFMEGKS